MNHSESRGRTCEFLLILLSAEISMWIVKLYIERAVEDVARHKVIQKLRQESQHDLLEHIVIAMILRFRGILSASSQRAA